MTSGVRLAVLVVSGGLFALTLTAFRFAPFPAGLPALIMLGLVFLGTLFESYRYKRLHQSGPPPGWQDTGERFRDPETGKRVAVFYNPDTGERMYVGEEGRGQ